MYRKIRFQTTKAFRELIGSLNVLRTSICCSDISKVIDKNDYHNIYIIASKVNERVSRANFKQFKVSDNYIPTIMKKVFSQQYYKNVYLGDKSSEAYQKSSSATERVVHRHDSHRR